LENELNEFRIDANILLDEINILSKKIKSSSLQDNSLEESLVDKAITDNSNVVEAIKLNKICIRNFEKLKNELEVVIRRSKESKEKEIKNNIQQEDRDYSSACEKLILNNKFIDELNNQVFQWESDLKLSALQYFSDNSDQIQQNAENLNQSNTLGNVNF